MIRARHRVSLGCALDLTHDPSVQITLVSIQLRQRLHRLIHDVKAGVRPVALDDRVAQPPPREPEEALELEPLHDLEGDELIAQRDALLQRRRVNLDILEAAEGEQVQETFADLPHRQRWTNSGFDEIQQRRGRYGPAFAHEPHLDHGPADVLVNAGGAGCPRL